MVGSETSPRKPRAIASSASDTYLIRSSAVTSGESDAALGKIVTMPDGKRIHVMDRKTLQKAIVAAMKEFA